MYEASIVDKIINCIFVNKMFQTKHFPDVNDVGVCNFNELMQTIKTN